MTGSVSKTVGDRGREGGRGAFGWLLVAVPLALAAPALAEGQWEQDPKTGCQIWSANPLPTQIVQWTGKCLHDKASGRGKATWSLKEDAHKVISYYVGQMRDGKRNGSGSQYFSDGARFSGEYQDNYPNGFGIYVSPDGNRYEGKYVEGKMHGQGIRTWPNGDWYEGQFDDDKMHGLGVFHYKNGNRYEGPFVDGEMQGIGTAFYADGGRYSGPFEHGKMHGVGQCLRDDDTWAKCEWKHGEFVRWLE